MLNNGNKVNCEFSGEIVSYIYNEIGASERRRFESHMAGCSLCTDEFASISHARFSVFEWQKEEFAHLATPQFVIPYQTVPRAIKENVPAGFLASLRRLFSFPSLPVTAAAGLVLSVGLGFLLMNYPDGGDRSIAGNIEVEQARGPSVALPDSTAVSTEIEPNIPEGKVAPKPGKATPEKEIDPVRAVDSLRTKPSRQIMAGGQRSGNRIVNSGTVPLRKAPVLSNYDDSDDKSLRLSDLFDDGGAER